MTGPEPASADDAPPKFFKTINGWIVGATGSVLALAGLWAAISQLSGKVAEDSKAAAASNQVEESQAAAEPQTAAAPSGDEAAQQVSDEYPTAYTGGPYRVAWEGDRWVETTDGKVTNRYLDGGQDEEFTVVIDPVSKEEWRWPTSGGPLETRARNSEPWQPSEYSYKPE